MKALSILGTSSDAGKSWINTAFCALLKRKGYNVAPFKAQNMSNNAYVTLEGGEIGRAQAAQAEACGLRPIALMNPILLKPSGDSTSQLILHGIPQKHVQAGHYYQNIDALWNEITNVLDAWKTRCDVLIMEGAGSPVELNLTTRDIVNLKPIEYLDGRWLLACDIERGGVFAQGIGTVKLMPEADQARGLGLIVNKFRGDLTLFQDAAKHFAKHIRTPYLGVIPMRYDLQPETEDGFSLRNRTYQSGKKLAWIALPHVSNTQDAEPWNLDEGVQVQWIRKPQDLNDADAIILPGTKNTLADLQWLHESGIAQKIRQKAEAGLPIVGICGGYQMLGDRIEDPQGIAGKAGSCDGLGLLPIRTTYLAQKRVTQVTAHLQEATWHAYEIHMGRTEILQKTDPLLYVSEGNTQKPEGIRKNHIWGTYLHGLFEHAAAREALMGHRANPILWQDYKAGIYAGMADMLEEHLDLEGVFRYLDA